MFTVVATPTRLSLDEHFIKRPASTFFVTVEGDGMDEQGIRTGDTLIVDRSRTPGTRSIVRCRYRRRAVRAFLSPPWIGRNDCVWGVVSGLVRGSAMTVYGLVDCNNFFVSCERGIPPQS